jgi:asparagine synthase (glutamine-hydrolysing)
MSQARPAPAFAGSILVAEGGFDATLAAGRVHDRDGFVVAATGAPRFVDEGIARLARREGDAAAGAALAQAHGDDAPLHAHGRFAIMIADRRRRRVLLAVDRFATIPVCHATPGGRVAFATRADALPGIERTLDAQALFDYLYFHMIPSPRTVYRGVSRLPPAHRLVFDGTRAAIDAYWTPHFAPHRTASLPELEARFRALLESAVRDRAGEGATGAFLSGGTDSSTIAGYLGRVTQAPARTYSIGFDVAGYDEMAFARIAAQHFRTDHHEYYVDAADIVDNVAQLAARYDQPFGNSSALPAYCCARMARGDGIECLLAGDGGDELFGGNERYAKQRVFEAYQWLPGGLRAALIEPALGTEALGRVALVRKMRSYVEQARVPLPDRMEMYNLLRRLGLADVLDPAFLAAIDTELPLRDQRATYARAGEAALIDRMLAYDWKYTLADNDLPKVVESAALAGVHVGFPMLDERLVEFSCELPPALKLRGLKLRWFFKRALRDFLPEAILRKRKHGFGLPFGAWAMAPGPLRDLAVDALEGVGRRGIVRRGFASQLVDTLLPQHPGYYGEMVWILMSLELWLRSEPAALPLRNDLRAAA